MPIRKHGNGWIVRRGIVKCVSTRKEATAFLMLLESGLADVQRKHAEQARPCCRIRDKIGEFLSDSEIGLRRRPCAPKTLAMYKKRLLMFDAAFHSKPLDAITREEVESWIRRRKRNNARGGTVTAGTINTDLVSLRAFAAWAQGKGYAPASLPLMTVGKLRVTGTISGTGRKPPKSLDMGEVLDAVARIKALREDIGLLLEGMILLCLRPHALCLLRRNELKLPMNGNPGRIKSAALKGYYERSLPILPGTAYHTWAREVLALAKRTLRRAPRPDEPLMICTTMRSRTNPGGWTTGTLDKAMARVCEKLAFRFTPYQIRHSVLSWLQQNPGISPATTQAAAAHASIATQDFYGKRNAQDAMPAYVAISELMARHKKNDSGEDQGGGVSSG